MFQPKKRFTHNTTVLIPPKFWTGDEGPDTYWYDYISHSYGWFLIILAGFVALNRNF